MRPHSLRSHSPVSLAFAEAGPLAVLREQLRAVDEVIARMAHVRNTEKALDLDTEAERHKLVFADTSQALRGELRSIEAPLGQFKAQGPGAMAAIRRHTWSPEPGGSAGLSMQQLFLNQVRRLRHTQCARFTEQLKPYDEAIRTLRTARSSTDARLADCNATLEKLRLTLPHKTHDRAQLQSSINALERQIGERTADARTRTDLDRVRVPSLQAEIVMHTLAHKKEHYLDSLHQVLSRYRTRLTAQQLITPATWRRVMERHPGLTPESLKSRIAHGHFETAQGQAVSTAPVERASSYHHEAHVLLAIFDAAAHAPSATSLAPDTEHTTSITHGREVGLVVHFHQNTAREAPATASRVSFALQRDGHVRITHLHPDE